MRVLITGAGGQLGRALAAVYADMDIVALARADLDITDDDAVTSVVRAISPELILNTAACTAVDACEDNPEPAWQVNAAGAWAVARASAAHDVPIVHVSTDYVFDGSASRPYSEWDATGPRSVYGRTKLAGEHLVRATARRHFVVRTSWLHGTGSNFLSTMLRLGRTKDRVRVVADQRGSPTFADDLGAAIRALADTHRYGTYHVTNSGSCTWHDLAGAAFNEAGLDVKCEPIDTATFGARAPRPAYSVLDNRVARLAGIAPLPHWRDGLRRWLSLHA